MNSTEDELLIRKENKICFITVNRPERRNSRTKAVNLRIMQTFLDADADPDIFMVCVTGVGDKAFSAGNDLKAAREEREVTGKINYGPLHQTHRSLFEVMIDSRKPSMAIVNGPAVAGGFELALACDLRVVADHAFFAVPESKRGRAAHFASVVLPQMVPMGIAMEWLFTGRRIPLEEAQRWGLVNRVAPYEKLMDTAMELADEVLSSAPLSIQRQKVTYRKTLGMPLLAGLRLDAGPNPYGTEDEMEGIRAYLEKRPPVWKGR